MKLSVSNTEMAVRRRGAGFYQSCHLSIELYPPFHEQHRINYSSHQQLLLYNDISQRKLSPLSSHQTPILLYSVMQQRFCVACIIKLIFKLFILSVLRALKICSEQSATAKYSIFYLLCTNEVCIKDGSRVRFVKMSGSSCKQLCKWGSALHFRQFSAMGNGTKRKKALHLLHPFCQSTVSSSRGCFSLQYMSRNICVDLTEYSFRWLRFISLFPDAFRNYSSLPVSRGLHQP